MLSSTRAGEQDADREWLLIQGVAAWIRDGASMTARAASAALADTEDAP